VTREAERREAADDNEEYCDDPHRQRIGSGPDGLDGASLAPGHSADDPDFGLSGQRLVE
jgi:hypothetical protein